ncbi:hypothetical protein RRG08_023467 [Elysia crispata]|uniref:Uncharacterized protein n=1 Tax=Elysia crispata TaxID=231223 RepID=A0AAE1DWW7_9GAST|nr:hypothetical protein RRG08_023467 [Elysia crispata]
MCVDRERGEEKSKRDGGEKESKTDTLKCEKYPRLVAVYHQVSSAGISEASRAIPSITSNFLSHSGLVTGFLSNSPRGSGLVLWGVREALVQTLLVTIVGEG